MEFYQDLYSDIESKEKLNKIKQKLTRNEFVPFLHLITLPLMKDGMLEIYPAYILRQDIYKKMEIKVVGIATGHTEAMELVQKIVENCMKETGKTDLSNYLRFD